MDFADSQALPRLSLQYFVFVISRKPAHDTPPNARRAVSCPTARVCGNLADRSRRVAAPRGYNTGGGSHAVRSLFLRLDSYRWSHLRTRRGHRSRPGPQTQEEGIQEVP